MMTLMGGDRRMLRAMWTAALFFALLAAAGLAGLDRIVDTSLPTAPAATLWNAGVALLDMAALRTIDDWLLPFVLLIAALILLVLRSTRAVGFPLLYVALVQILSYGAADLSKPWFGRVRPSEAAGSDIWFIGGNSFPSGHTAFFAGLFLPLVILFPRLAPLWIVPPLFVAIARIMVEDHYLSDVSIAFALAAALSAALAFVAAKGRDA